MERGTITKEGRRAEEGAKGEAAVAGKGLETGPAERDEDGTFDGMGEDGDGYEYGEEGEGEKDTPKYKMAPEILEDYVTRIVNSHRGDLAQAKFAAMLRKGKWSSRDIDTWASTRTVSAQMKTLIGACDYIITVSGDVWGSLTDVQRLALIDHELCHCFKDEDGAGNPVWRTVGHDIEEFFAIIRRHGAWREEIKSALRAYEESKQVTMFDFSAEKQKKEDEIWKASFDAAFGDGAGNG
jgi:hypothetical protein